MDIQKLAKLVYENGGKAYVVGGSIRDSYINKIEVEEYLKECNEDIDLEVIGVSKEIFENKILKDYKFKKVGKVYPIYLVEKKYEVSLIVEDKPIIDCARRRDLTMNSIYWDILDGKIYDYFGGIKDIEDKLLRIISEEEYFKDTIRMLRTIEFSSRLGFKIETFSEELIMKNSQGILNSSKERVYEELIKIFMKSSKPSVGFKLIEKLLILKKLFPELERLKYIEQDKVYHPEGDVWTHTLMMLDVLPVEKRSAELLLAILYHDVGKADTYPNFKNHSSLSTEIFKKNIGKLTNEKKLIKIVSKLIECHERPLEILLSGVFTDTQVKKLAVEVEEVDLLLELYRCDVLGRGRKNNETELEVIRKISKRYEEIKEELEPIVTGKVLLEMGFVPGKIISEIIEKLYIEQVEGRIKTLLEAKEIIGDLYL